jgi:hypothetical protein
MGMFNNIVCEYELPDLPKFVEPGHKFQTKDTEPLTLETHTIDKTGRIDIDDFTGDVEFYSSNIVASGPGIYTQNGEDAASVRYSARFVAGRLVRIARTEYERTAGMEEKRLHYTPTKEQAGVRRERLTESLLGRTIFVMRGESSYAGRVVHENAKQIVIEGDSGAEVLNRADRDRLFFDSLEDTKKYSDAKLRQWQFKKNEYDRYAAEWKAKRDALGEP